MATDTLLAGLAELARPGGADSLPTALAPLAGPQGGRYRELIERNHLIASLVDALKRSNHDVPEDLAMALADDQVARLQIRRTTKMVREALGDRIPWVVIKGPAVAAVMDRPELRTYNDLDLLIPGRHLEAAIDCLCDGGMVELNQNWEPYLKYQVGEIPMAGFRTTIDVHWDPVALGRVRQSVHFDVATMVDRRTTVLVDGLGPLPVLEPVDQLLHLAVHCALSGATRFDQFRDLSSAAKLLTGKDDWDHFVGRARSVGGARLAAHALDRADLAIGIGLPAGLIDDLGGRITIRFRRRFDRSRLGLRRFIVDSWRDRTSETAATFATKMVSAWSSGQRGGWDFTDKGGRLYYGRPTGGSQGRRDFLAMAAELSHTAKTSKAER